MSGVIFDIKKSKKLAVPIMVGLLLPASKKEVMSVFTSGPKTRWFGWGGVAVMGFAVLVMVWDLVRQMV